MNKHKIRCITEYIRGFGRLPTNRLGQILSIDELMGYFDLNECLNEYERAFMRMEFAAMVEAELFMDSYRARKI